MDIDVHFLKEALAFEEAGNLRQALGLVYRRVEVMMELGMTDLLNEEIASFAADKIGTDVLLGLLTATLPVKSKLPSRRHLFRQTKRILKARKHYERGILDGLK